MGNQPSSPSTPPPPSNPPPPLPPSCDMDCQRRNNLESLKTAMDLAEKTKDTNPEGYEQARIKYNTLLNGQGWLAKEKERIAKNEIEPTVVEYTSKFKELTGAQKSQDIFVNLAGALKAQSDEDISDNAFLKRQLSSGTDKTANLNRLSQISGIPDGFSFTAYIPIILDIVIGIICIAIVYMLYRKFVPAITVQQPSILGGKRR